MAHPAARAALSAGAAAGGLIAFAWFAHQAWPAGVIGALGLAITAGAIVSTSARDAEPAALLGIGRIPAWFSVLGALIGAAAGLAHRASLDLPLVSDFSVEPFVVLACVIGATEELIYRGWMLARLRTLGWPAAIVLTAIAHAAYKTALFAQPSVAVPINYWSLALLTAVGGSVLGALRAVSGSLWPAIIAHVVFDFVVYRALAHAPWWVWG